MPQPLSDRLFKIASLVPHCTAVADIGADHAWLSIFLLETGVCERVFCTDIKELPLAKARIALTAQNLSDRAECLLGDGLCALRSKNPDCIVIAGLGGDSIRDILIADTQFLKDKTLVLQPMSKHTSLRLALSHYGFCVQEEILASDNGKIYPVIRAFYDGIPRKLASLELLCGRQNLIRRDRLTLQYLHSLLSSLVRRRDGRLSAGLEASAEEKLICSLSEHLSTQENQEE